MITSFSGQYEFLSNFYPCVVVFEGYNTGDRKLIEGNSWGDTYWGVCRGKGDNWLGILLMALRESLR